MRKSLRSHLIYCCFFLFTILMRFLTHGFWLGWMTHRVLPLLVMNLKKQMRSWREMRQIQVNQALWVFRKATLHKYTHYLIHMHECCARVWHLHSSAYFTAFPSFLNDVVHDVFGGQTFVDSLQTAVHCDLTCREKLQEKTCKDTHQCQFNRQKSFIHVIV